MIDLIKSDIKKYPNIFFAFGEIDSEQLRKELSLYNFNFPKELIDLWVEFGGGDFFQTETILYPLKNNSKDNIVDFNRACKAQGLPDKYFVFHIGTGGYTAIQTKTGEIVNIDEPEWKVSCRYSSFLVWFKSLRDELILMRYET